MVLRIDQLGFKRGKVEEFPSEGTKEVYVGNEDYPGRLLLMEPIGEGPYASALAKRGEGLHHVAVNVKNLDEYVQNLSGSGWYLHPKSVETLKYKFPTVWLARPGVPVLIEVHERSFKSADPDSSSFISLVSLPKLAAKPELFEVLGSKVIRSSKDDKFWIGIGSDQYEIREVISGESFVR